MQIYLIFVVDHNWLRLIEVDWSSTEANQCSSTVINRNRPQSTAINHQLTSIWWLHCNLIILTSNDVKLGRYTSIAHHIRAYMNITCELMCIDAYRRVSTSIDRHLTSIWSLYSNVIILTSNDVKSGWLWSNAVQYCS